MIAAGAWTPQVVRMISSAEAAEPIHLGIQPRKGHLLEISESLAPPVIKHGLMEIGYAKVSKEAFKYCSAARLESGEFRASHLPWEAWYEPWYNPCQTSSLFRPGHVKGEPPRIRHFQ